MSSDPNSADNLLPADRRAMIAGIGGLAAGALLAGSRTAHAGPLTPPAGPVASTGKTTQEIFNAVTSEERRGWIPVGPSTTPGAGNALYIISQPGCYYLTGPITVASGVGFRYGIRIDASDVTLDLNGHRIYALGFPCAAIGSSNSSASGRRICNGAILAENAAVGIESPGLRSIVEDLDITVQIIDTVGINLRDSSGVLIRRCRFNGLSGDFAITGGLTDNVTVEDVIVDGSSWRRNGILLRSTAVLRRCLVRVCGSPGIATGEGAVIEDCVVGPTSSSGIVVGDRSTVSNCTVDRTGGIGIDTGSQCIVQRCRSTTNTTGGIRVVTSCLVRECFVDFHPNSPQYNIKSLGSATQIVDNVVTRGFIGIDFQGVTGCVAMRNLGRANINSISVNGGGNWYPFVDFNTLNTATNPFANLFT